MQHYVTSKISYCTTHFIMSRIKCFLVPRTIKISEQTTVLYGLIKRQQDDGTDVRIVTQHHCQYCICLTCLGTNIAKCSV